MKRKGNPAVLILPLLIIVATNTISLRSFSCAFERIFSNPLPTLLEYFILLGLCLALYGIFCRLSVAYIVPATVSSTLTLISYFKEEISGAPLVLQDLSYATGVADIASFALDALRFTPTMLITILAQILIFVFLVLADKKKNGKKIRLIPLVAGVLMILFFVTPPGFSAVTKIHSAISQQETGQEEKVKEYGVIPGMYFAYAETRVKNFNPSAKEIALLKEYADRALSERVENPEAKTPNVIFVMSEAFFDPTVLPHVSFSTDPCPNFRRLSDSCTSGSFISTTYSGGTGYVEAELLTGICSHFLKGSGTITSLDNDVFPKLPVITDVFKNYGYTTTFLHSYNSALYNRQAMYEGFGFDNILFDDSFPSDTVKYNSFISDDDFTSKIISVLEDNGDSPCFIYAVSMENHYPYAGWKYPEKAVSVESEILNDAEKEVLESLACGIYNADAALGRLVEYLEGCDEDYMLIFFGDHLPNLSVDGGSVYTSLGVSPSNVTTEWEPDTLCRMLSTDYLIMTSYDEKEQYPDRAEGCTFLGLGVLKRLGFTLSDYFQYLDYHIENKVTLYRPRLFLDRDMNASGAIPEEYSQVMGTWKTAIRDIIYANGQVFGK